MLLLALAAAAGVLVAAARPRVRRTAAIGWVPGGNGQTWKINLPKPGEYYVANAPGQFALFNKISEIILNLIIRQLVKRYHIIFGQPAGGRPIRKQR